MSAHDELLAGLRPLLPRYELVRVIGEGGMGVVVEARVPASGERVAVKLIRPGFLSDPEMQARFARESRLLVELMSPYIVRVLDTGGAQGWHYLVMEYLEGDNLAQLLERRPRLPVSEALAILDALAEALAALHARGVVHRDLKPANVLVPARGAPRLIDFGLARDPKQSALTEAGAFLGTVAYAAPECLELKPATAASDVWQLGAMFFEMTTGQRGFRRADALTVMAETLAGDPQRAAAVRLAERLLEPEPKLRAADGAAVVALRQGRVAPDAVTERLPQRPVSRARPALAPAADPPVTPRPAAPAPPAAAPAGRSVAGVARAVLGWGIVALLIAVALGTVLLLPQLMKRAASGS